MNESDPYLLSPSPELERLFVELQEHAGRNEWSLALQSAEGMLQLAPDAIPPRLLAAQVLLRLDRYRDARRLTLQATAGLIEPPNMFMQAMRLLRKFEAPEAMARLFSGIDWGQAREVNQLRELVPMLITVGLYSEADECLEAAARLAPDDPDLACLRGMLYMVLGNATESLRELERALQREPRLAMAHGLIAMQAEKSLAGDHVRRMRAIQAAIVPGSDGEAQLCYALHNRLDALGRHDEAWAALLRGHAVMQQRVPYDREGSLRLFDELEAMELAVPERDSVPIPSTRLVFIVGMFRSGTTLIERILAGHNDVKDGGETFQFTAAMREAVDHDIPIVVDRITTSRAARGDYDLVRERMEAYAVWRARGKGTVTEKLPANFLNIGFILHALPHARIVHLRRDPVQTCFSNLRTLFRDTAPYASDQRCMAEYFLRYQRLMAHWRSIAPGRMLDVDYSALVAQPEAQARRLLEYCGLQYDPAVMELGRKGGATATASATEVRRGILTDRGEAWKPYAPMLQPMLEMLAGGN